MNLHTTNLTTVVERFLQPFAFRVIGNVVHVTNQENLKYLKNKLAKEGFTDIQVLYSDGKCTFTEAQLRTLMVIGECNDKNFVFDTLNKLHAHHKFTKLIYLHPHPSPMKPLDGLAFGWASEKDLQMKHVPIQWRFGRNAALIAYSKLLGKRSRAKPDIVVAFTNGEITSQVTKARQARIEVVFAEHGRVSVGS